MEHNLRISVSRKPMRNDVAALHTISLRERVLRFLFGRKQQIAIIVPGDSVKELQSATLRKEEQHDGENE